MSRDVVFVYDHFYPDYSAGGPVTSLANLADLLVDSCNVRILTGSTYYNSGKKLDGVSFNQWSVRGRYSVWYAESSSSIHDAIESLPKNSSVYLNGVFSKRFFFDVLRLCKKYKHHVVISPRGMLQRGALQNKPFKKNLYLTFLRFATRIKGVRWHATDSEEQSDIKKHFGSKVSVEVIPNVPRSASTSKITIEKHPGQLKLVYFSLISRKKNLRFLLELLNNLKLPGVTLDIVGPVKDPDYWLECQPSIRQAHGSINYVGDVSPSEVNNLLSRYHLFVLPTNGENFGHAIVEAMASFRPVLISDATPWKDVTPTAGGFSVPLVTSAWETSLKLAHNWSQKEFDEACVGAMSYFQKKVSMSALKSMYLSLFQIQS